MLGLSRPHSMAIWRVRESAAVLLVVFAALWVASPLLTALTFGDGEPVAWVIVTFALLTLGAGVVLCCTYPAERREIADRVWREDRERADGPK